MLAALPALGTAQTSPATDVSERCQVWAQAGECMLNEGYMRTKCGASCQQMQSLASESSAARARPELTVAAGEQSLVAPEAAPLVDPARAASQCAAWAAANQCVANPRFMCHACEMACKQHEDENCPIWAAKNECRSNPAFMLEQCRVACSWKEDDVQYWQNMFASHPGATLILNGPEGGRGERAEPLALPV